MVPEIPTETKRITAVNLEILQIETFVVRLCDHLLNISGDYRKIPKISPGAYIFQRPFSRGLFLEGLIFGGAYLRREICVSKSIGLAL